MQQHVLLKLLFLAPWLAILRGLKALSFLI